MILGRGYRHAVNCTSTQDIAHHDFAFEDIIDDSKQQLKILAKALGVSHKVQAGLSTLNQDRPDHQQALSILALPLTRSMRCEVCMLTRDNVSGMKVLNALFICRTQEGQCDAGGHQVSGRACRCT